jgi:predicted dehydrogenase
VVGSRGSLTISSLETGLRRSDEVRTVAVDTTFSPLVHGHLGGMFAFELRHFVDCIRGRTRPAITPQDALMALRIALAVERAAASGRSVQP